MSGTAKTALGALWVLAAVAASAETEPDPEVARVRTEFEYGKFAEALKRASERIDRGNLSEAEVRELHKYAGLSAFYLNHKSQAERHLWALLQLDPDYTFDPFVVPPAAVQYFESLRTKRSSQLETIREERRRRAERLKAEADERERARLEAELQRRRAEELSKPLMVTTVERRSFLLNLVPFGVGQFQQHRTKAGLIFAISEGVLATTSIVAYLVSNSLIQEQVIRVDDRLTPDGTFSFVTRGIPPDRHRRAIVWRNIKYASGAGFWVTYGIGVVDAIVHHQGEVVISGEAQAAPPQALQLPPAPQQVRALRPFVNPAHNGVQAGITFSF
jgi:hypothetical protein